MLNIKEIEEDLLKKEKVLDEIFSRNREMVRLSANAIKEMHACNFQNAKKLLECEEAQLKVLSIQAKKHGLDLNHIMQEYGEAKILLYAIEKKELPSSTELNITPESYLTALLDCIGEFKREMYEALRKRKKKDAEYYFNLMERVYDELLPLKFSNALLPDFRRKQDIARMQIEQARGELL